MHKAQSPNAARFSNSYLLSFDAKGHAMQLIPPIFQD